MCLLPKYFSGYCKTKASFNHGQRTTNGGHPNGFTLLELIVVISLLGIMLVMAVPRFHETLFLDESKTSSRWVIGKIQALKERGGPQSEKLYPAYRSGFGAFLGNG
jgi:prepilin-type N-terminal cleavage/methylation domain-containing protein